MSLQPINSPTTWKRAQTSINANFTALVNALAGEGTVDATDPVVTALLTDNGSGAYAAVEGIVEDVAGDMLPPATAGALDWEMATSAFGAVDHATVQAAATAAASSGKRLYAAGEYTTDQTLTLECDADLSGLTINYTGSGVACRVGKTSGRLQVVNVRAPKVTTGKAAGGGWASVAGTVGIELANLYSSQVLIPYVSGFETGLLCTAYGSNGTVHNTVTIGHLENNKVNQRVTAGDSDAWCNQNVFLGGRFSHFSDEGSEVSGARHVQIDQTVHMVNTNTWIGASFEGDTPDYHAAISGVENLFENCRWEVSGGARVLWHGGAAGNMILRGYEAHLINESFSSAGTGNLIWSRNRGRFNGSGSTSGVLLLENTSSSSYPADVVLGTGATNAGADPATAYAVARSAVMTRMKRTTDAEDRLQLDHANGKVLFGDGSSAPVRAIWFVPANGSLRLDGFATRTSGVATGGSAQTLPAAPTGYLRVNIDGTNRDIPYY